MTPRDQSGSAKRWNRLMDSQYTYPWRSDAGDGSYRNPIIHADYSDPDVIRQGDEFYMVASSFTATPGLPILHSRDLVNWTLINHAIQNVPGARYAQVQPGCGVWAPSIRFHAGKFWIFFPLPDEGIYVTTAEHPAGKWCEPWLLQAARGWIDPCPFWDDDGRAYLAHAYANSRAGIRDTIHIRPMAPDGAALLGEGRAVIHAPQHPYLEGPKVHKFDGWYYILAPGGGVPTGWQVAFRARDIFGPYEQKIVLERGSTSINGPHQGALIDLPNGEFWFIHFQDTGPFGRIVHLQPVTWKNHWPLMGQDFDGNGIGEPVASWRKPAVGATFETPSPQTSDEFDSPNLALQWQWQANHANDWYSLADRPGWLRLFAQAEANKDLSRVPNLLMQKFPARGFSAETLVDATAANGGISAGLAIVGGGESAALALERGADGALCVLRINGEPRFRAEAPAKTMRLRVAVDSTATCRFSYAGVTGHFVAIDQFFQAKEGGWMGAKVGVFALSSTPAAHGVFADFDYFRVGR